MSPTIAPKYKLPNFGTNYNASEVGTIETSGRFSNSVAPYLGIGFGTPINSGFGFNLYLGVMFAGSPTVSLSANNVSPSVSTSIQDQFRSDLATQERKTSADIKSFNLYPVVSIGFSYAIEYKHYAKSSSSPHSYTAISSLCRSR